MKKVLAITLMLLLVATAAMAAENSWRILLLADDGFGNNAGSRRYVGVAPTGQEGLDSQDGATASYGTDTPGTTNLLSAVVTGATPLYGKSIKAATLPVPEKTWDFYVAGNANAVGEGIRIKAMTVANQLPTPTFAGAPAPLQYAIRMVNNRGMVDAPANGSLWLIPTPAVGTAGNVMFWSSPINLPRLNLAVGTSAQLVANGYKLQFVQMPPVPEPSGLLALGAGLMGLVGFVTRRRK